MLYDPETPVPERETLDDLEALSPEEKSLVERRAAWIERARPEQIAPTGTSWTYFLLLGGRGMGKTRSASEETSYRCATRPNIRWAYVAPTSNDLRRTCFEGQSGLLACTPKEVLRGGSIEKAYNRSLGELYYANGSKIEGYSAEQPDRLRGGNFHGATCEELAAWNNGKPDECWDLLDLAVRHPPFPQYIIATTPKPIPLLRRLIKDPKAVVSRGSTYANRANLAPSFIERLKKYENTKYGKQEIYGEILDEDEGAIFSRNWFKLWPKGRGLPAFSYIFLSIDGAFSEKETADNSACSAWGVFRLARRRKNSDVWLPSKPCIMLLDLWADKLRFGDLQDAVEKSCEATYGGKLGKRLADGTRIQEVPGRHPDIILIENKASGQSLLQQLWDKDLPVAPYEPGRMDKAMRAHSASPWVLNGHVWIMESTDPAREGRCVDWADPLLEQACDFTGDPSSLPLHPNDNRRHDDELDTMTQAINWAYAENIFAEGGPLGDEGASEAHERFIKDPSLWPAHADGDRGYGVQSYRPAGMHRNPYDG